MSDPKEKDKDKRGSGRPATKFMEPPTQKSGGETDQHPEDEGAGGEMDELAENQDSGLIQPDSKKKGEGPKPRRGGEPRKEKSGQDSDKEEMGKE